jgi:hypothetical protein
VQYEVLEGKDSTYYHTKINGIKQDIQDGEKGIVGLYQKKSELIKAWAICLEQLGELEVNTICRVIIKELVDLDCKRGIAYVWEVLDPKYKRDWKHDSVGVGNEDKETKLGFPSLDVGSFLELPNEIISLPTAPAEDLQENEEALGKLVKEAKRRWQEYIDEMRRRGVARVGQKESDVEGTPRPYDPIHGFFYAEMVGLADDTANLSKTCRDISEKIEYYPPETQKEDKLLADGIKSWRTLLQWVNEHLRPYADLKFSQSYPDWWASEALNKDFGKHAAAVKSKVATLSGGYRSLTREQIGDLVPKLADRALNFKGALDIANKAFVLLQKDMPYWRKRRLDPSVGTRKENVGPKLSESAFGSSKDS